MKIRFITKDIHAFLDYPVAVSLMVAPFLLNLGSSHPMAKWLAFGTGIAAFILTLLTNHKLGVFRVMPYTRFTLPLIFLWALLFFWHSNNFWISVVLDACYYWINAVCSTVCCWPA